MEKKKRTREAVIFREKRSDQSVFLKGEAVIFRERRREGCCFQRGSVRVSAQRRAAPEKFWKTLLHQRSRTIERKKDLHLTASFFIQG